MLETFHTDRLLLRPLTMDDAADLYEVHRDEEAMRFMPFPPHRRIEHTLDMLSEYLHTEDAHYWAIRRRDEGRVLGYVSYTGRRRFPNMAYVLHREVWGQGITAEACRPVLDYGFKKLGYERIEVWIHEDNDASMRVATKLGFKPKGRMPVHSFRFQRQGFEIYFMTIWGMRAVEWAEAALETPEETATPSEPRFFTVEPVLPVRDIAATMNYYREKLGFRRGQTRGNPPEWASVWYGEWTGNLVRVYFLQAKPAEPITPSYVRIRMNGFSRELRETLSENGVEIVETPSEQSWSFSEFAIRDLNGHVLIFVTEF